ncbi:hypothetical protein PAPYR_2374 [Paratrimastix pyriformis]|uniref:Uncharacterized protein n=1 Tax=Paratrimastix pyriformis TaxID=342808 RepID=A0ABQ8UQ84_9EUKA|nr:hypothetical protein PAPYR_2374 [Paratrimastix pyriformis]
MRVIVIRHGFRMDESDGGEWKRATGELWWDPPLVPNDLYPSEAAKLFRGPFDPNRVVFYSSPFQRCLETCKLVSRTLFPERNPRIVVLPGLSEVLAPSLVPSFRDIFTESYFQSKFPGCDFDLSRLHTKPAYPEKWDKAAERYASVWHGVCERDEPANCDGRLAILVTHGYGVETLLDQADAGLCRRMTGLDYCAFFEATRTDAPRGSGRPGWRVVAHHGMHFVEEETPSVVPAANPHVF